MEIEILTKHDLEVFRQKLMHELAEFFYKHSDQAEKEFLRSKEVRKLLGGISSGTLQNLRVKGILKPSKIEGVFYYKLSDVKALLSAGTGI
jgi:hypothetical protein